LRNVAVCRRPSNMKLGVHILAYNVSRFIGPVIENAGPHVDRIYIAYSTRAFGYNAEKRDTPNPTRREELLATPFADKTVVIDGDWALDEEARNACLQRARQDGCDYLLVQDADEFYPEESWAANKAALAAAREPLTYKTSWYNFWKTPEYVIQDAKGSIVDHNASFAIPCASDVHFSWKRTTSVGHGIPVLPGICFHFGYALTDGEMLEKISTWSHTNDMFDLQGWYRHKWLGWTPDTRNLHVAYPPQWPRAVRFEARRPHFADALELSLHDTPRSRLDPLGNGFYDARVAGFAAGRHLKRSLLGLRKRTFQRLNVPRALG
jgi:hypothetical protein